MKKTLFFVAGTLALMAFLNVAAAVAADAPANTPANKGGIREGMAELGEKLNLTAEQKEAIRKILTEAREKVKTAADRQAKIAVFKEAVQKIKNDVLTAEQRKKLEDLKIRLEEILRERRQHNGKGGAAAGQGTT